MSHRMNESILSVVSLIPKFFLVSLNLFETRRARLMSRHPRLGDSLSNLDENSLKPQIKVIDKKDIDESEREIQKKIEELNTRLFEGHGNTLLTNPHNKDPNGFICEKQVLNVKEVSQVVAVNCYDSTEEVCELVSVTPFKNPKNN